MGTEKMTKSATFKYTSIGSPSLAFSLCLLVIAQIRLRFCMLPVPLLLSIPLKDQFRGTRVTLLKLKRATKLTRAIVPHCNHWPKHPLHKRCQTKYGGHQDRNGYFGANDAPDSGDHAHCDVLGELSPVNSEELPPGAPDHCPFSQAYFDQVFMIEVTTSAAPAPTRISTAILLPQKPDQ